MTLSNSAFCGALCYYLDHLKVDLKHRRMEFLRDLADRIVAMTNGYTTSSGRGSGKYGMYKLSCYASTDALAILASGGWNAKLLHQEHVIPIKEVGNLLLMFVQTPKTNQQILDRLNELVIPCVITTKENNLINQSSLRQTMPPDWNSPWDRYLAVNVGGARISKIIALRNSLSSHSWPSSNWPVFSSITGYAAPMPFQPVPICDCTNGAYLNTLDCPDSES